VLIGLGLVEIAAALAWRGPPGSFVRMPARLLAFAVGIAVLVLLTGGLG
jgi:hypothetical protein